MTLLILELLLGLALILVGANYLVDGSAGIARRFGISEFVVGMTIVGIGTSTPEMVVSFIASVNGNPDMAVGNIVGSNIANVFLILGVTAVLKPIGLTRGNIVFDIPICMVASLLFFLLMMDGIFDSNAENILSRIDGLVLLTGFAAFMYYSFKSNGAEFEETIPEQTKTVPVWLSTLFIVGGLVGLIFGGKLFVNSGSSLAVSFGVSDAFIGITVMALGTSMPELAASVVAAVKGKGQMALGNIIGSNISNILLILGGSALIRPLTIGNITIVDMLVMLASTIVMFIANSTFKKKQIDRIEGGLFLLTYIGYVTYLVINS